jgi:hypothetical protein
MYKIGNDSYFRWKERSNGFGQQSLILATKAEAVQRGNLGINLHYDITTDVIAIARLSVPFSKAFPSHQIGRAQRWHPIYIVAHMTLTSSLLCLKYPTAFLA